LPAPFETTFVLAMLAAIGDIRSHRFFLLCIPSAGFS
jgi:hypothetical protein